LAYFDDLSQSEIASQLGVPLGTVKSRMRLAMNRMREVVADLTPEA
jgi:RNA polymerase sigma-70 factor, ECF subfamily